MASFKLKLPSADICSGKIKSVITLVCPFLLMDIIIRVLSVGVRYRLAVIVFPGILFSVMWMGLIAAFSMMLGRCAGRIFYGLTFAVFFVMFFVHSVYYPYTGFFFSFNLLESAAEGSAYVGSTLKQTSFFVYLYSVVVLASGIFVLVRFPQTERAHPKTFVKVFIVFLALHFVTPLFLGQKNKSLEWDTWRNPRNVYESFSDSNKCIKICGFFEYTVRDFYTTFIKPKEEALPDETAFLEAAYSVKTPHKENDYTGIFEGKNVIFLQLEGIDSWLLNETDMPNLYSMMDNSLVFDRHYSYYTGGGSTFNSELAVITGFLTPVSYTKNPYSFNTNHYPGSLPKLLKEKGYTCNAFHMNSGEYYMREKNYLNWGFDRYYSLIDDGDYSDITYELDRELILNELFYEKLFGAKEPFLHYIISYTNHTPFSLDSKMGGLLAEKVFGEDAEIPEMNEEETARLYASETDYMIGLLLEALQENGLLENTVIVAYADHYLYTLSDKTILDKYKKTDNNLINQTPFLIWSHDMKGTHIGKVNSQLDILPTVLNMLGIEYYDEYYIGKDIMDKGYDGYVFFSDYSWYDGVNYVELGKVINNGHADTSYIDAANTEINNLIRKNDLTLKYDYFKKISNDNKIQRSDK